jgi:hypothetical protein
VRPTDIGIRLVVIAVLIGLYVWSPLVGVAALALVVGYVLAQRTGPVRCSPSVLYAVFLGVPRPIDPMVNSCARVNGPNTLHNCNS